MKNGSETDVDCGGLSCPACAVTKACLLDTDCVDSGVCDTGKCRDAVSCAEVLLHHPTSKDGMYTIAPAGVAASFGAVCDMTRGGGGFTLLLKANGDTTLNYFASAWTDTTLLNQTDLTTGAGNAKYMSFLSVPLTTLRGELDGFLYSQTFGAATTAQTLFGGNAAVVANFPTIGTGANWSYQPNCQTFGVNTPYQYARSRFGWSANQEGDCNSNDTAIGLGLDDQGQAANQHGAGYECLSTQCSGGNVNTGGNGLLWAR